MHFWTYKILTLRICLENPDLEYVYYIRQSMEPVVRKQQFSNQKLRPLAQVFAIM